MAKNKTVETDGSVENYIQSIADESKRKDTAAIVALMQQQTGLPPKMWGSSIVGFGSYHYKYKSGHEGDAPLAALSARANAITLYLGFFEEKEALLKELGKHKQGKACVYIKKLADVKEEVLRKLVQLSVQPR